MTICYKYFIKPIEDLLYWGIGIFCISTGVFFFFSIQLSHVQNKKSSGSHWLPEAQRSYTEGHQWQTSVSVKNVAEDFRVHCHFIWWLFYFYFSKFIILSFHRYLFSGLRCYEARVATHCFWGCFWNMQTLCFSRDNRVYCIWPVFFNGCSVQFLALSFT